MEICIFLMLTLTFFWTDKPKWEGQGQVSYLLPCFKHDPQMWGMGRRTGMGRFGRAEELVRSSLFLCNSLLPAVTQEKKVSQQCLQRALALRVLRQCELMASGGWVLLSRRFNRGLFGVAAATKTMVGLFEQQWERLSSLAVEGSRRRKES